MDMTGRERMMAACRGQETDRVPVSPDISNYIPCRFTGKPFWNIYVDEQPPLWRAYLDAVERLGIDAWFIYGDLKFEFESHISMVNANRITRTGTYWDVEKIIHTPDGDLNQISRIYTNNPPTKIKKVVEDIQKDYQKFRHLFSKAIGFDMSLLVQQKKSLGELGLMGVDVSVPGFPTYLSYFNGNLEALTFAYHDYPDIFEELVTLHHDQSVSITEMIIDVGEVDSIIIGMSGGITLQSPDIFDKISLPTIKKITAMCRQAGVISGLHSCGKEHHIVKRCVEETDLDYINPLEVPPMGDCSLAALREDFGTGMTLMGNLHTIDVMRNGRREDVRRESLRAIVAAGRHGRFILSTGDQCGYDTPEENLKEMVNVGRVFGTYPLDLERIESELKRLGGVRPR